MTFQRISLTKAEGVATITFNDDPEYLNAWDLRSLEDFEIAFDDLERDDGVRAVIITGAGRTFSSGGDIRELAEQTELGPALCKERIRRHDCMVRRLVELEKPTIAAVNGLSVGSGMNIALGCDFIIASEQACFSQILTQRALLPDLGGMWLLPRAVGLARAKELVFTGEMIGAQEAARIGLAIRVVPHEELMVEAEMLAQELAGNPPMALAMTKVVLRLDEHMDMRRYVEYEALAQAMCMRTEDHREGVQAFMEKRTPVFKGR